MFPIMLLDGLLDIILPAALTLDFIPLPAFWIDEAPAIRRFPSSSSSSGRALDRVRRVDKRLRFEREDEACVCERPFDRLVRRPPPLDWPLAPFLVLLRVGYRPTFASPSSSSLTMKPFSLGRLRVRRRA